MAEEPTLLLLAGEASGDHHGAALVRALRRRIPEARFVGTGGPAMEAEGVSLLAGLDDLAVMGFVEVLGRLRFFRRLEGGVRRRVDEGVDLVVPIDYPGFNMRVTAYAHRRGVPVLWYIAPQVWAWKPGRARVLAEQTRHVAVILPFEEEVWRAAGADVTYVGNPLTERPDSVPSRAAFCAETGLDPARPILGVLPGSRLQELDRHLDLFTEAARRVVRERPEVQVAFGRAPSLPENVSSPPDVVVTTDARALQRHSRAALVKSGTSTLETALEDTPMAVAYRTSGLTWQIAKRLVRVDHISLVNLVAGTEVVPEFLQAAATPRALAGALLPLLEDGPERARQLRGFAAVRERLGEGAASERVADLAVKILNGGGG